MTKDRFDRTSNRYNFVQGKNIKTAGDETLILLFEQQAIKIPTQIAVEHNNARTNYAELNLSANQLADNLINAGAKPGDIIAFLLEPSISMISVILGILKAGCAYLPLDIEAPSDRHKKLLAIAEAPILITDKKQPLQLPSHIKILYPDENNTSDIKQNINRTNSHNDTAYIIFTSGSTGTPKGVMVSHKNVLNYARWIGDQLKISNETRFDLSSPITFDFTVTSSLVPLLYGATIIITDKITKQNFNSYLKHLKQNNITHIKLTPSYFNNLLIYQNVVKNLVSLKYIVLGGEPLIKKDVIKWFELNQKQQIINEYGPTETTVGTVAFMMDCQTPLHHSTIPIGQPIYNTSLCIINSHGEPVVINEPGELYIAGDSVSKGYLNEEKLTAEKFIQTSFNSTITQTFYKTGDMVTLTEEGLLLYHGRNDDQIKIRGMRIEPSEIESTILSDKNITQAVVVNTTEDYHQQKLIAYLTLKAPPFDENTLRMKLAEALPAHMIPSRFILLEKIPMTPNGKIDRKTLREQKNRTNEESNNTSHPKNNDERILAAIWAELLGMMPHQITLKDDFFELGGHSLLALPLITRLRQYYGVQLTLGDFFEYRTIPSQLSYIQQLLATQRPIKFQRTEKMEESPLSTAQEIIWRHQKLYQDYPLYNQPINIFIQQSLNKEALQDAINDLIKQHDILRIKIIEKNGLPYQQVTAYTPVELEETSLESIEPSKRLAKAIALASELANQPLLLDKPSLIRFHLFKLNDESYYFFILAHHLISDGVTLLQIFPKEIEQSYNQHANKLKIAPTSTSSSLQYTDFATWEQKAHLQSKQNLEIHREFWRNYLKDLPRLKLPYQRLPNSKTKPSGHQLCFQYPKELSQKIEKIGKYYGATMFTFLFSLFSILIYRYTEQTDLSIGTVSSGRYLVETVQMIGNFANMLLLRVKLDPTSSLKEHIAAVKTLLKNAFAHQNLPFQEILGLLPQSQQTLSTPPIQAAFIFQPPKHKSLYDWSISQIEAHPTTSTFNLTFDLSWDDGLLVGRAEYNTNLFDEWFIQQAIDHYGLLLHYAIDQLDTPIYRLSLLTSKENKKIITDWNRTKTAFLDDKTIHKLFEEQAKKTANSIAVIDQYKKISYEELNNAANTLAHELISNQVNTSSLVPIYLDRSIELIIAILAILKTGAAYVPIATDNPTERINQILNEIEAQIIVTESKYEKQLNKDNLIKLPLDTLHYSQTTSSKNPNIATNPHQLAYVLFTSGSTGKPKGVCIEHQSVINLVAEQIKAFQLNNDTITLGFASQGFDASVSEYFTTLLSGGTLNLTYQKDKSLINTLKKEKINCITLPPSFLQTLNPQEFPKLKTLVVAGEKCSSALINRWINTADILINAYGPTEACVCTTLTYCDINTKVTIGKPIGNIQVYVLNSLLQPTPIGVIGELYIAGVGLARGYLNNPELTYEQFIPNPFGEGRIYKTGDLVRWLPDGNLEFIGRLDDQVKIRGFRIECGEVETHLNSYHAVQQSVVIAREDIVGDKYLAAYLVSNNQPSIHELRQHLAEYLPDYMIPSTFTFLPKLPLTKNGKVDKNALPKPMEQQLDIISIAKPQTATEKAIAKIWRKTLHHRHISLHDNFFVIGGHSLKALQIIAEINKKLKTQLTLRDIFQYSTIAKLAIRIEHHAHATQLSPLVPLKTTGDKTPLFLIHPIGGTVFCYMPLIKYFDINRPLYALQDPGIETGEIYFDSVEAMAQEYIKTIKTIQPKGPYLLGGLSSGATLSIEMANQLEAAGESVKFVGLIDGWAIYPESLQQKENLDKNLKEHHEKWISAYPENRLVELEKLLDLQWKRLRMFANYAFHRITHSLTLFKAKDLWEQFNEVREEKFNQWNKFTDQKIARYDIPGNHQSILEEPNVKELAARLNKVLEECC